MTLQTESAKKGSRRFPWKCPSCLKLEVFPDKVSYTAEIKHDGVLHTVHLPELETPKCRSCGEMLFDDSSDEQINHALRLQLRLLSPLQIRQSRTNLSLTQNELAKRLGVAEVTIAEWESGARIQSRAMDNLLRLYFTLPEARAVLSEMGQDHQLGTSV